MTRLPAAALLALAFAAPMRAQAPRERPQWPPFAPPADFVPDPRDAGFAEWLAAGAGGRVVAPILLSEGRYRVLIQSAVARHQPAAGPEALRRALAVCALDFRIPREAQDQLIAERAWQAFDAVMDGVPAVAITIVPAEPRPTRCFNDDSVRKVLVGYGIATGSDALGHARNDALGIGVFVGDREVAPVLVARRLVTKLAPSGFIGPDGLHNLRVYLPFDAFAPSGAAPPRMRFEVWNAEDDGPTVIEIPPEIVRELQRELMQWRIRRLAMSAPVPQGLPISLPAPRDNLLQQSRQSFLAGAYVDATASALNRLDSRFVVLDDRTSALMQVGLTFAGLGDEAAARVVLREALEREPCLSLPISAPTEFLALIKDLRPIARCEAASLGQILRLGLIPGRAQRRLRPENASAGFLPAALTGAAAVSSIVLHLRVDKLVREYETDRRNPHVAFNKAAEAHATANTVGAVAYGIWAVSVVEVIINERRRGRNARRMTNYGADAPAVSIGPAPRGVGLSINVSF